MSTFALAADALNVTPQEVAQKSVEVKQPSAKPPYLESSTFQNTVYFRCSFQL